MSYQELDYIFPFVVFFYGALITFVLNHSYLMKIAEEKLPFELNQQLKGHRILALSCLIIGGLWSLQNLML